MMPAARGQALLVSGSLVVCAALAFATLPALAQGGGGRSQRPAETVPPGVKKLWREYPLDPRRSPAAPARTSTTGPGANEPTTADEDRDSMAKRMLWPVVFALAGVLSVLVLALFLGLRPASALGRMAPRPRRRRRARLPDVAAVSTSKARPAAAEEETVAPYSMLERSTGKGEAGLAEAREAESGLAEAGYDRVAEQVTAVLISAQQAGDRIREAARQEAELMQAEAKEKAAAAIAEATLASEQVRRESDDVRAEADRYGEETRETANRRLEEMRREIRREAARRRADAERQAREISRAAEQEAMNLELEADQRQKELVLEAERFETRSRQLVTIFREFTSQLDALVGAEQAAGQATPNMRPPSRTRSTTGSIVAASPSDPGSSSSSPSTRRRAF
jgi:hypothetical protein